MEGMGHDARFGYYAQIQESMFALGRTAYDVDKLINEMERTPIGYVEATAKAIKDDADKRS